MKLLIIGDPHITPDSLEEGNRLMEFAFEQARQRDIKTVVIMGDLFHTHAMVRVEVAHFWTLWIYKAAGLGLELVMLVGNHDMPGNASGDPFVHALAVYKGFGNVKVIDKPTALYPAGVRVPPALVFMPYYADPEKFVADANDNPADFLFCHQTFVGARYESNFPAPDGVDPDSISHPIIISGHIHMQQVLGEGRVVYVGSPRWLTASDANQARGIHALDTETKDLDFISTAGVCRQIVSATVTPDDPDPVFQAEGNVRIILTLKGPKLWIQEKMESTPGLKLLGIEIRSVYVEEKEPEVRESEGLAVSLQKYVLAKDWPVSKELLWDQIQRRVPWLSKNR